MWGIGYTDWDGIYYEVPFKYKEKIYLMMSDFKVHEYTFLGITSPKNQIPSVYGEWEDGGEIRRGLICLVTNIGKSLFNNEDDALKSEPALVAW
jgi:hypothetical protein